MHSNKKGNGGGHSHTDQKNGKDYVKNVEEPGERGNHGDHKKRKEKMTILVKRLRLIHRFIQSTWLVNSQPKNYLKKGISRKTKKIIHKRATLY